MGLKDLFRRAPEERDDSLSFSQFMNYFSYGGLAYGLGGGPTITGNHEEIGPGFENYVSGMLKSNGIVFTCMAVRLRIFSDVRFNFREINNGRPGRLYDGLDGRNPASKGLRLLQEPEPGLTTGDLLAHMIQDVDLSGNAFVYRDGQTLRRLRPDWMTIVYGSRRKDGSPWDLDAELLGYMYLPGGPGSGNDPVPLLPDHVAHWAPQPDPLSPRRGMSWLTPIMREVQSDLAATSHKLKFFQNDATINNVMEFEPGVTKDLFEYAKESFNAQHQGVDNAYKTLFLLGAKMHNIGVDFKQMDFKVIQGSMETRIASASGVHPVLAAFSEGLQGSSLNAGNFSSARRATADITFRPMWRNLCGSLAHIIETPANAELWYDDRDCMFLQEDRKDAAEIQFTQAQSVRQLVDGGYEPNSVVEAVMAEDMTLLKHSGLMSVQLLPPGEKSEPDPPKALAPVPEPVVKAASIDYTARNEAEVARSLAEIALQEALRNREQALPAPAPEVNVDVAPAQVTVNTPEIRNQIEVAPANVPDVYVTTPEVNVTTPEVRVDPQIDVHTPDVHIDVAQPQIDVHTPEVRVEPQIDVHTPEVRVDVQPAQVDVAAPTVNVTTPEVNVTTPDVRVDPQIDVHLPEAPEIHVDPTIEVSTEAAKDWRTVRMTPERGVDGFYTSLTERQEDGEGHTRTVYKRVERDDEGDIAAVVVTHIEEED